MPYFSNYQHILLYSLNRLSEILPEKMTDFITYVHSPSINVAFLNPITCNICNVFFNLRILQIQLWHSSIIAKTFVVWNLSHFTFRWQFINKIPVQISGFFTIFQNIPECEKISACMIVYRIQNYLHTTLMCFLYQLPKILCCSK